MVTIYDVAARAGVSPATVSRVFAGQVNVSPDLAEAVRRAAAELGFLPNRGAQRLRTATSRIVAMMVPDIENPFFTAVTRAVEDVARAAGYSVMLCNTDEDPAREEEYLRVAVQEPVAGVVIAPSARARLGLAVDRGLPVVCVDRHAAGYSLDAVVADNRAAAAAATSLLLKAGYRRIACVTGPAGVETADDRLAGWSDALAALGQAPSADLVRRVPFTVEGGTAATCELLALAGPPDAVFAANNRLAAGTLAALAAAGRLPPATGVVSFGGSPLMLLAPPGVIVTQLPARALGLRAAEMLLERIAGLDGPARSETLPISVTP